MTNNMNEKDIAKGFESFGLKKAVLDGVRDAGFTNPSKVQQEAIPVAMNGRDLIAQAQTGTGKTAAFALPILNQLKRDGDIEALIITPTRELAMQISDEVFKLGKFLRVKTVCVYGGQSIKRQCELLDKLPNVLIATPGRLLDHLKNERIQNFNPKIVVLDESDEMLDMGFLDDIDEIFSYLPSNRQTLLFSATMPAQIQKLATKILDNPEYVKVTPTNITNTDIVQKCYVINEGHRDEAVVRLMEVLNPTKSIIFTRTKKEADALSVRLREMGYKSRALHGDMEQRDRIDSIKAFKTSQNMILVATDVAARGLDISDVSHVFNYHIPLNSESYVHRIGRTGRAGKKGMAITLITPLELKELRRIQDDVKMPLELEEIPSCNSGESKLLGAILKTKISDDALSLYSELMESCDEANAVLKLISYIMKNSSGLKIGLSKDEIEKLKAAPDSKNNKGNSRGGFSRGGNRDRGDSRGDNRNRRGNFRRSR